MYWHNEQYGNKKLNENTRYITKIDLKHECSAKLNLSKRNESIYKSQMIRISFFPK